MKLTDFFKNYKKAGLALSGGVDSAYLLYAARQSNTSIHAYFVKTPFQPQFELEDAQALTLQLGVTLQIIELDALSFPAVAANPADRCYHCKQALFTALRDRAMADGYTLLLDGTNASDDAGDRPGMRALMELRVLSPLRTCGITKTQLREYLRKYRTKFFPSRASKRSNEKD